MTRKEEIQAELNKIAEQEEFLYWQKQKLKTELRDIHQQERLEATKTRYARFVEVVKMRDEEKLSFREIGEKLGVSIARATGIYREAKANFRRRSPEQIHKLSTTGKLK